MRSPIISTHTLQAHTYPIVINNTTNMLSDRILAISKLYDRQDAKCDLLLESMPLLPGDTSPSKPDVRFSPHPAPSRLLLIPLIGVTFVLYEPVCVLACTGDNDGVALPNLTASNCHGCRRCGVVPPYSAFRNSPLTPAMMARLNPFIAALGSSTLLSIVSWLIRSKHFSMSSSTIFFSHPLCEAFRC